MTNFVCGLTLRLNWTTESERTAKCVSVIPGDKSAAIESPSANDCGKGRPKRSSELFHNQCIFFLWQKIWISGLIPGFQPSIPYLTRGNPLALFYTLASLLQTVTLPKYGIRCHCCNYEVLRVHRHSKFFIVNSFLAKIGIFRHIGQKFSNFFFLRAFSQ